ncbi:MAG: hypothetical protein CL537_06135 [Alcanivoracaceae bacterium]|uniref:hypothetical protein n=1 Tax=Alcanivorax sp. MD8A TaxID=1177157 RepID=UPI000C5F0AE8|nr:hypothetical protein [Alcanivorax sp. MD8A]MAX55077.1 hypothetical protein [Alcanivoracaceae bacterium]MCG8436639.1 phosphate ABC transporter substrate-binding protein [Pseudomonadales bacterium]MED5430915.1 hypothetical protein [Pseudomonadota bacterium]MEE2870120.1 hypothetical protein [Pseudomonadota bacterium]PNE04234.1 phosphate ABC transporter periplasmic protein [Alcanivorax sp. MD8A]|tara:strand:- start:6533 stop:6949 length:417 start_codon:yes stop_codon:yes gene_type:complete
MKKLQWLASLILFLPMVVMADIVVVVDKDSPITSISQNQIRQVYLEGGGKVDGVYVKPLDLPEQDKLRDRFYQDTVGKTPAQMKSYWARMIFTGRGVPPRSVSGVSAMKVMLENNPELIGYLPANQVSGNLRVLHQIR